MTSSNLNSGALAPVCNEVDCFDLTVKGQIPPELDGVLLRNGPNPLEGRFRGKDLQAWWSQAAMFHSLQLAKGRALVYRNRWARTKAWAHHFCAAESNSYLETNPSVNFVHHAGETLALAEGGLPIAISPDLQTLGPSAHHVSLAHGLMAHPKVDPATGQLVWFKADWQQPYLRYGVINPRGNSEYETEIHLSQPVMMHDFAISQTQSIFLDLNVAYDFTLLQEGFAMPLRWHPSKQARLGVMPRLGGAVKWIEIEPCFIQHVANAYESDESKIVFDAIAYDHFFALNPKEKEYLPNPLGYLRRYEIDLGRETASETQLGRTAVEMPVINPRHTGRPYRFIYAVEQPTDKELRGLVKVDMDSGTLERHSFGEGDQNSEPVFISKLNPKREDDGWLLSWVYKGTTQTSEVVILDAADIQSPPVATIALGRRIPAGFHGLWLPSAHPLA